MKLYQFDEWYQQAVDYWSDPNHIECPDACVDQLNRLKDAIDSYFSSSGDNFVWFKRCISAMLGLRMKKYHIRYDDPNVPSVSGEPDTFPPLLSAFVIDLPDIETLFSTYTSTSPDESCIECGESESTSGSKTCLDVSKIESLIDQLEQAPDDDVKRILNFLKSLDEMDRTLYFIFKKEAKLTIHVDDIDIMDLAKECELDKVLQVYKWQIPGYDVGG